MIKETQSLEKELGTTQSPMDVHPTLPKLAHSQAPKNNRWVLS